MARRLFPLEISSPGSLGLNKQGGDGVLPLGFATEARNLVYNEVGRLASRKGGRVFYGDSTGPFTNENVNLGSYRDDSGISVLVTSIGGVGNLVSLKDGPSTSEDVSTGISNALADYKFVTFNGSLVGHDPSYPPVVKTQAIGSNFTNATGNQFNGEDVLSAFGRIWILTDNGKNLRYSDLLINDFASGSAGSFDLNIFFPDGDRGIALAEWNDYLVVFGSKNIIIYENPDSPTTAMQITDIIEGVGCAARDSVQVVGPDIMFLSNGGIKALGRVIQEKSLPQKDISKNIRDYLVGFVAGESRIRSVYSESQALYLISFRDAAKVFAFDMRSRMQDGTYRITEWDMRVTAMVEMDNEIVMVKEIGTTGTYQAYLYEGYVDEQLNDRSGGVPYEIDYEGVWNDFGGEIAQNLKIYKTLTALVAGSPGDSATVKWAIDYVNNFSEREITFPATADVAAGIKVPMDGAGEVVKVGLKSNIFGSEKILRRFNILAKLGRYV